MHALSLAALSSYLHSIAFSVEGASTLSQTITNGSPWAPLGSRIPILAIKKKGASGRMNSLHLVLLPAASLAWASAMIAVNGLWGNGSHRELGSCLEHHSKMSVVHRFHSRNTFWVQWVYPLHRHGSLRVRDRDHNAGDELAMKYVEDDDNNHRSSIN